MVVPTGLIEKLQRHNIKIHVLWSQQLTYSVLRSATSGSAVKNKLTLVFESKGHLLPLFLEGSINMVL